MSERSEILQHCEELAAIAHETGLKEDLDRWRAAEETLVKLDQDFRQ